MENPLLLTDFYKQFHHNHYLKGITRIYSVYTPRTTRLSEFNVNEVVVFGLQVFIKEYLVNYFDKYFFKADIEEIIKDYTVTMLATTDCNIEDLNITGFRELHKLGYLPIIINGLPEGTLCPVGCPVFEIYNTDDRFAWLVNFLESLISSELWYPMIVARMSMLYREIAKEAFHKTSDKSSVSAISEFGFRGNTSKDSAIKASMAFLLNFNKTATIPAIKKINSIYRDDLSTIGSGMISTEHSVMCSAMALGMSEEDYIKYLITEKHPSGNISIVLDSKDYFHVITHIIPKLKNEILSRKGTVFVRGDSGDPVDITISTTRILMKIFNDEVEINSKNYKTLPPQIRVIYGDSITQARAIDIYNTLQEDGFAADNVALGAGSFSMLCIENEIGKLYPFTRDTMGVAIKAVAGMCDGKTFNILKDPATDTSKIKKSLSGKVLVYDRRGEIKHIDNLPLTDTRKGMYVPYFKDGILMNNDSFADVRNRLWYNNFNTNL